jgi:hypothetical protein
MKLAFVVVTILIALSIVMAGEGEKPRGFKFTTRKTDDAVEFHTGKDRTVFDIKSPSGISQAVVERQDARWPEVVTVRLHLKSLENFRASTDKLKLEAAVSDKEGKMKARLWKDGKEDALLDEKSPFWMDIRALKGDGTPAAAIPLDNGYFEMTLPKTFFEGNPKSITLNWIDFYRN